MYVPSLNFLNFKTFCFVRWGGSHIHDYISLTCCLHHQCVVCHYFTCVPYIAVSKATSLVGVITSTELTEPLYFSHPLKFTLYSFSFRFIAELWSNMFSALPFARQLFTSLSDALTGRNEVSEFAFSFWVLRHTFVFSAVSQIQFLTLAILARGQVQICQIWNNLCKVLPTRED